MKHVKFVNFLRYGLVGALFLLGIRFFLPIAMPFLFAAALALWADKAVRWMHTKLKFPQAAASVVGISGVFCLTATVLTLLLGSLVRQLPRLTGLLPQMEEAIHSGKQLLQQWLFDLAGKLPGSFGAVLTGWAENLQMQDSAILAPLMQQLPKLATSLAGKMGQGMFSFLTGLIASFMLSIRLPKLRRWLRENLPESLQIRLTAARKGLRQALGGWGLAQLKLAAITFGILCAGFFLLRIPNALVWAFLITLVDAFPILGVGTVLLPWALVAALQGNYALALGLTAIYVVAWLLRQVAEPRFVGKGLGLDPFVTLVVIYAGYRLWGIGGMLLAPIGATALAQVWKAVQAPEGQENPASESPKPKKNQG